MKIGAKLISLLARIEVAAGCLMMGDSEDAGEGAKGKLSCVAVYCGSKPPKNEVFNQRAQGEAELTFDTNLQQ